MHTKFKKLVDDICRQENFSHSELSVLIDKSRNYIGRLYRDGSSEKTIERAIMLLERLNVQIEPTMLEIENELFVVANSTLAKSNEKLIAENEMLRKQDSYRVQVLDKRNDLLENAKFENEQLENTVKNLQTVLNERTIELEEHKLHIANLNEKLGDQYSAKHINAFMGWCILALLIVIGVVWFK